MKNFVKRKKVHLKKEKSNIVENFFSLEKIHQFFESQKNEHFEIFQKSSFLEKNEHFLNFYFAY